MAREGGPVTAAVSGHGLGAVFWMLFGELIVWYLFLGGVGGGAYLAWYGLRYLPAEPEARIRFEKPLTSFMLAVSLVCLAAGSVCLLADLAAPQRAHLLFIRPTFSVISIGAFALALLMTLVAVLFMWRVLNPSAPRRNRRIRSAVEAVCALVTLVVVAYTGVLLCSMPSVALWRSAWIPVLFVLSSCSSGVAVAGIGTALAFWSRPRAAGLARCLMKADAVLLTTEIAAFALMIWQIHDMTGVAQSLEMLISGEYALAFWVGFLGLGVVVPLLAEIVVVVARPKSLLPYAIIGCCILIGAFFLRYCIANAGVHLSLFMFAGL